MNCTLVLLHAEELSMTFTHYDLGNLSRGEVVEITLKGSAANVRLMDTSNFNSFRREGRHTYVGGLAKQSPVRLAVPRSGHWHVTVDMNGLKGTVRSSIRVLPGALKPIQDAPLSSIPSLVRRDEDIFSGDAEISRTYDVFISHASEDKDEVVRPLALALQAGGLAVWYDEFELKIGDSLRRKIDKGLGSSRFGIVVLSKPFFNKGWTNYELDGLVTRSISGEQNLLPIWHNVSKSEVITYSASLADKVARNTSSYTVEEIADEIIGLVKGS